MKKIILILLVTCIFSLFSLIKVNAGEIGQTVTDNTKKSSFTATEVEEEDLYGVHHEIVKGTAATGGATYGQMLNEFEMKTDGHTSKLVAWAVQKDNTFYKRASITVAAKDYEERNPGWIVIGGINADQYFFTFGTKIAEDGSANYQPSPYYPMISNGDKLFTVTTAYNNYKNVVGFKNDGSTTPFAYPDGLGGYYLTIIDANGKELKSFEVKGINKTIASGETTIHIPEFINDSQGLVTPLTVNTTNNLYVVNDAELSFYALDSNFKYGFAAVDSGFAKGTIDSLDKNVTLDKGKFAIETTNEELIKELNLGVRVKFEQKWTNDDMNACDEAIGYHTCHKKDGVEIATTSSYNTRQYSRALFGKRADGTYVLITADMVQAVGSYGLNDTQTNAVANYYGLTDLYQMDGGGSVTAMMRQADGKFKVTNYPKDSGNPMNPREDFSFLFFVVKDPGIKCNTTENTYHSIKLEKSETSSIIQNVKVTCNNKTYDFNDELVIDGLIADTDYVVTINYEVKDGDDVYASSFEIKTKTEKYTFPTYPIIIKKISKKEFVFEKVSSDISKNIKNVVLYVGDETYNMGSEDTYTVSELIDDTPYVVHYTYDIYDELTGVTYSTSGGEGTYKTLSYELPEVTEFGYTFSDNVVKITYQYKDKDRKVTEAYILVNDTKYPVTVKTGTLKLDDLDIENTDYAFKLVLVYEEGVVESIEWEVKKTGPNEPTPPVLGENTEPAPTKKKKCGKKSLDLIISLISLTTVLSFALRKRR